ncbi:MAG: hypothetical protein OEX04_13235 [Acidimicrobiia bacterium]|nr:hypothetical protein [Acidimicrobiia bacterium]
MPAAYGGPPDALERYEMAVDRLPDVDRKGAKNPYTSRNGHMFSFLDQDGRIAIRLSDDARAEFAAAHGDEPVIQYGAVMRGYVWVPDSLDVDAIAELLEQSHAWIGTLKPKPTRKKS